jgi:methionyl-tRNA formyltransferase
LAPILKKEHGFIDWSMPARNIHNRVRAFQPWPGAVTKFQETPCKIFKTSLPDQAVQGAPGTILPSKKSLTVVCGDSRALEVVSIQPENRRPVSGAEFANGARIQPGEKFLPMMDN